jgi:AcrR family transcriptional regulator
MRDLIREGVISPRAEEVAARADVGLRTVFRHFDDMETLNREIAALALFEVAPMLDLPAPSGTLEERLETMVDRRAKLFEKLMPFRISADVNMHRSAYLREDRNRMNAAIREATRAALSDELRKDRTLLEAVDAVLSFDFWHRLRNEQNLSIAQAKRVMEMTARALLLAPREKR